MSKTVKAVYRNGEVQLLETPDGVREGQVLVTFSDIAVEEVLARRERARKWLRETSWDLGGAPYPRAARNCTIGPARKWRGRSLIRTSSSIHATEENPSNTPEPSS